MRRFLMTCIAVAVSALLSGCMSTPIVDRYDPEKHAWLKHVVAADSRGKFDHHLLPKGYPCLGEGEDENGRNDVRDCHLKS